MKTMAVEISRTQTLTFWVSVPDHWTPQITRRRMGMPVITEITEDADDFDWENDPPQLSVDSIQVCIDADQVDYEFDDEPAPPHPDQMPLIAGVEP